MAEREPLSEEEIADLHGEPLPDREAMSILSTSPTALPGYEDGAALVGGTGSDGSSAGSGAADTASGTTDGYLADAEGSSSSEEPTVTSEPRSETYSSSDSAYAES